MSDLGSKIRRGTSWLFADKLGTEVLQFVFGIVLARILVPADFGLVATVGVLTGLAGFFSGAGMSQALVRAHTAEPRHFDVVLSLQLGIGAAIYALFTLIAPWFAEFFGNPLYQELLLVSAISFFLRPFSNIPAAALARAMNFRPITLINASMLLGTGTVTIVLALRGFGPWSLILGGLFGSALKPLLFYFATRRYPRLAFDRAIARELGSYGFRVAANSLLEHLRGKTLILLLSKMQGPADVGLFSRAAGLAEAPMRVVGTAPYQAVFRALASIQHSIDQSKYIYYRTITLVAVYTLPFFVGLWWLAEPAILALYGEKWRASADPLRILAFAGIFQCFGNPSGAVVEARNRIGTEIALNVVAWILLIPSAIFALRWGIAGVAVVALSCVAIISIGVTIIAARELDGTARDMARALTPALILNGIMVAVLWAADEMVVEALRDPAPMLYVLAMSACGVLTYVVALLFLPIPELHTEVQRWRGRLKWHTTMR